MKSILSGILLLFITGCSAIPVPREMGEMEFIRTIGVDGGAEVSVTASTGRRARGLQREVEPPLVLSGEGQSVSDALHVAEKQTERIPFYGYVDQLLLGDELCRSGIESTLMYLARNSELGLGTEVWSVDGSAQDAINSGSDEGVDTRLQTLRQEDALGVGAITRTASEVLTEVLENGASYIPRLRLGEDGTLQNDGYTIIIGDQQVGALVADGARGLELLVGSACGTVYTQGDLVAEVQAVRTKVCPIIVDDCCVGATVNCCLTAQLTEFGAEPSEETLSALCDGVSIRARAHINAAVEGLQLLDADAVGILRQLGVRAPSLWADIQRMEFNDLPIQVEVQVEMRGR